MLQKFGNKTWYKIPLWKVPPIADKIKRLILPGNDAIFCGDKKRGLTIEAPKKFNAVRTNYSSYK